MTETTASPPFDTVPRTAQGHFAIALYAAVHHLTLHVGELGELGGPTLAAVLERYPFLGSYLAEIRRHLPAELGGEAATAWWEETLAAWEWQSVVHLPLAALRRDLPLSFRGLLALLVVGLVEEDSRFGTLLAELQEPLAARRPTLELVGRIVLPLGGQGRAAGDLDAWGLCRPLLEGGFVQALNPQAPRSEQALRIPSPVWDALRGGPAGQPQAGCRVLDRAELPTFDDLILPGELRERLARIPDLLAAGRARILLVRGALDTDPLEALGAVARRAGRNLLVADPSCLADDERRGALGPLATLTGSLPVFSWDLAPGETAELPPLAGYDGPVGLALGLEGGLKDAAAEGLLSLTLPPSTAELRREHWRRSGEAVAELEAIAERFLFGGAVIRQVARMAGAHAALAGRTAIRQDDVCEASRALNRQKLEGLAAPLAASGRWDDLVTSEGTAAKLYELERRCRHRERLLGELGPAFGNAANRGVRALFTGPSGTGKTLAARILAAELGMDLYRVDLAAVINKYIGETEKNLHRVLADAEALDVVLLLDEGDALLGQRTEVRSANDRFANLETNYLLQRLEGYQGIVVVTTNLGENIDPAFQRRMDVVVPFLPPQAEERWRILALHLPPGHGVGAEVLDRVACRCTLTGGQIRNAAMHATLLALDERLPLERRHLEEALRSEYRKAGGTFPLSDPVTDPAGRDGGVSAFLTALAGS